MVGLRIARAVSKAALEHEIESMRKDSSQKPFGLKGMMSGAIF